MAHLGYLLTALADGQLSPATTEKVLEHVAVCRPCAAELAAERRARRVLAEAECESVGADLAARLRTICDQPVGETGPGVPAAKPARRAMAWVGLGTAVGASALAACLFVVGGPRDAVPVWTEAGALATLGAVAEAPPAADAPEGAFAAMPASTGTLPSGLADDVFTVTAHRSLAGGQGSVTELSGRRGHAVIAVQTGRLDASSVAHLRPVELFGAERHILSTEPWHVVWQSGDEVVELITDLPPQQVAELVTHFPADEYDVDLAARFARGWSTVSEGWTR